MEKDGKLGIIISNSWLGTDIGKKFFEALQYYYVIESVIISNCKRWFNNADVIGTILILKKKEISIPDKTDRIRFWLTNKDINTIEDEDKETLINSSGNVWAANRIQHICNTAIHKSPIYGLFSFSKR